MTKHRILDLGVPGDLMPGKWPSLVEPPNITERARRFEAFEVEMLNQIYAASRIDAAELRRLQRPKNFKASRVAIRMQQQLTAALDREALLALSDPSCGQGTFANAVPGDTLSVLVELAELGRAMERERRAHLASATKLLQLVTDAAAPGFIPVIMGCSEALETQVLNPTAAATIIRLVECGDLDIWEEDWLPADELFVYRAPRDPFDFMSLPLRLPEPPELPLFRWTLPQLDRPVTFGPIVTLSVDIAAPRPRGPRSRRQQRREDVRAGLVARRARMRRRSAP